MNKPLFAEDREAWRDWLARHHAAEKEVWLIFYKKHTAKNWVSYNEAVEEAVCFGWIDGIARRVDEDKYMQRFTPRQAKSIWSESNKARVRKMIREGKMTPAGLVAVQAAKKNGQWQKTGSQDNGLD